MAYDLVVGKSPQIKDNPVICGGIDFSEYPMVCGLAQESGSQFLDCISNLFQDQAFSLSDLEDARSELFALLPKDFEHGKRAVLYKMTAVVCFALYKQQPLFGVAD